MRTRGLAIGGAALVIGNLVLLGYFLTPTYMRAISASWSGLGYAVGAWVAVNVIVGFIVWSVAARARGERPRS
jgi:hypothetical protein